MNNEELKLFNLTFEEEEKIKYYKCYLSEADVIYDVLRKYRHKQIIDEKEMAKEILSAFLSYWESTTENRNNVASIIKEKILSKL